MCMCMYVVKVNLHVYIYIPPVIQSACILYVAMSFVAAGTQREGQAQQFHKNQEP